MSSPSTGKQEELLPHIRRFLFPKFPSFHPKSDLGIACFHPGYVASPVQSWKSQFSSVNLFFVGSLLSTVSNKCFWPGNPKRFFHQPVHHWPRPNVNLQLSVDPQKQDRGTMAGRSWVEKQQDWGSQVTYSKVCLCGQECSNGFGKLVWNSCQNGGRTHGKLSYMKRNLLFCGVPTHV